MEYTDKIYGTLSIDEPVIVDLINSDAMQRLKEVNQYGASFYRFPHLNTTRFEHSVGVYEILRRLGASVQEQIVGLLHDAPHTAFSHVSDIVFEDASQAFHDRYHEKVIFESEIPKILKRHGFSVWKLLNKKNFHLAERELPDLCADRIDYFFRDTVTDKQLELRDARLILDDMAVIGGEIAFKSEERAKQFAEVFRGANEKLWAQPIQAALYYLLASAMKLSLEEGVMTFNDLFTTDNEVYDKMMQSGNDAIVKYLTDMEHITIEHNADDYDYHIVNKIRVVDPWVVQDVSRGTLARLSELDTTFAQINERVLEEGKKGYYIKIVE